MVWIWQQNLLVQEEYVKLLKEQDFGYGCMEGWYGCVDEGIGAAIEGWGLVLTK